MRKYVIKRDDGKYVKRKKNEVPYWTKDLNSAMLYDKVLADIIIYKCNLQDCQPIEVNIKEVRKG